MVSERLATYIIIFNVIMGFLIFFSSQIILLNLIGYKVVNIGTSIGYDYSNIPSGTAIPTRVFYPIPNYPMFIFIFTLIVNLLFIVRLRRNRE